MCYLKGALLTSHAIYKRDKGICKLAITERKYNADLGITLLTIFLVPLQLLIFETEVRLSKIKPEDVSPPCGFQQFGQNLRVVLEIRSIVLERHRRVRNFLFTFFFVFGVSKKFRK